MLNGQTDFVFVFQLIKSETHLSFLPNLTDSCIGLIERCSRPVQAIVRGFVCVSPEHFEETLVLN